MMMAGHSLIDWGVQPLPGKTLAQTCEATVKIAIVTLDLVRSTGSIALQTVTQKDIADFTIFNQVWACSILFEVWLSLIVFHYLDELVDQAFFSIGIDVEANEGNLFAMGRSGRRSRRSRKAERNLEKQRKRDQAIASRLGGRNAGEKETNYSAVESKHHVF